MFPLRALLVSYSFPPVGGAGVQRVAKLVKYLPEHGVQPAVLTVKNPSVPLRDETLLGDLPPGLRVLRARTLEPGYQVKQVAWSAAQAPSATARLRGRLLRVAGQLLVPDAQLLWQPGAAVALLRELRGPAPPHVVFVSAPPFSQFLLGPLVRLRSRGALVLDYRDEWSTYRSVYEMGQGGLGALLGGPLEQALVQRAHVITTATPEFRDNLLLRFPFLAPDRVVCVPNGYDPDDFPAVLPTPPPDRFVLSYAGTVFRLTSARGLLAALHRLHAQEPALARLLEVRFMGRIVNSEEDAFTGAEALGVRRLGYLDHLSVLRELAASHLCLCLLADVPGAERIYPGKIFELMYLGRPVLVLAPPSGALARLVRARRLGTVLPPGDEQAIAAFLAEQLRAFRAQRYVATTVASGIERYHRRALAGEMAAALRLAVAAATGRAVPPREGPRPGQPFPSAGSTDPALFH